MHPRIRHTGIATAFLLLIAFSTTPLLAQNYVSSDAFGKKELKFQTPKTPSSRAQNREPSQARSDSFRNVRQVSYELSVPADIWQNGKALEEEGLWGEALSLYQKTLKEFPDSDELKRRRALARIQFDLNRRYSDTSFMRTIRETGGAKALSVYAEVLLKIQSYYVDKPNWNQIAGYGLTSLEVALYKPDFQKFNLKDVSDQQIADAVQSTRDMLQRYPDD